MPMDQTRVMVGGEGRDASYHEPPMLAKNKPLTEGAVRRSRNLPQSSDDDRKHLICQGRVLVLYRPSHPTPYEARVSCVTEQQLNPAHINWRKGERFLSEEFDLFNFKYVYNDKYDCLPYLSYDISCQWVRKAAASAWKNDANWTHWRCDGEQIEREWAYAADKTGVCLSGASNVLAANSKSKTRVPCLFGGDESRCFDKAQRSFNNRKWIDLIVDNEYNDVYGPEQTTSTVFNRVYGRFGACKPFRTQWEQTQRTV
ncbi:hypothetical protein FB451DRAFT_1381785 [Mycena latifolia]|nr:hypothetical protein FB451DRAFT_1381785 [Mycena latifolia]